MQMAIDVAGFTPAEADELRRAMGSKRSAERMERLRGRLYAGMAERGITGEVADEIFEKLAAFANYGFPESHAMSFAYLVYAWAWFKLLPPGGVLRGAAQRPADGLLLARSRWCRTPAATGWSCAHPTSTPPRRATLEPCPGSHNAWPCASGLGSIRGLASPGAARRRAGSGIAAGRPYQDLEDLVRRVPA